jgi:ketosteroid isomerase-like protein
MAEQANRGAVERLWQCFAAGEWEQAGAVLADDFVAEWPHTGERIHGRENYLAINRYYPPVGWQIDVRRVVASGDLVAAEVFVPHDQGLTYALAWYTLRDGKIYRATEYWVDSHSEQPPEWRAQWVERT